jgi:hypothetical protein
MKNLLVLADFLGGTLHLRCEDPVGQLGSDI